VFSTPQLHDSLLAYSADLLEIREARIQKSRLEKWRDIAEVVVLVQVQSAADFFSTNKTLTNNPPTVDVDIILDPYVGNIFPRSLIPTAAYIVFLAVGSFLLSSTTWRWLQPSVSDKQHVD
jgi:hypothetical protein